MPRTKTPPEVPKRALADPSLFRIGSKKKPRYGVILRQDTAARLFALLQFETGDASDLVHSGIDAIYALFNNYPPKKHLPKVQGTRKRRATPVAEVLKGLGHDPTHPST